MSLSSISASGDGVRRRFDRSSLMMRDGSTPSRRLLVLAWRLPDSAGAVGASFSDLIDPVGCCCDVDAVALDIFLATVRLDSNAADKMRKPRKA